MKLNKSVFLVASVIAALSVSCSNKHLQSDRYRPVMGQITEFIATCKEASGICLAPNGDGLLVASDTDGIHHITWDGQVSDFYVHGGWFDCEGVTVDPKTKDVYYVFETKQEVHRLAAPDYDNDEVIYVLSDVGMGTNNGLEGITWYKDGNLLIGNQKKPVLLINYSLEKGELSRLNISGGTLREIADLCYDPQREVLWIADSKSRTINLCKADGSMILKIYDIPSIENAEGMCVDHKNSCIWVCDDTTGKIYKINFTNL